MLKNKDDLRVKHYKSYNFTVQGDHTWGTYVKNVGADLQAKYAKSHEVPAKTLMIIAEDDYQLKFNDPSEDTIMVNVAHAGKVFDFHVGRS